MANLKAFTLGTINTGYGSAKYLDGLSSTLWSAAKRRFPVVAELTDTPVKEFGQKMQSKGEEDGEYILDLIKPPSEWFDDDAPRGDGPSVKELKIKRDLGRRDEYIAELDAETDVDKKVAIQAKLDRVLDTISRH